MEVRLWSWSPWNNQEKIFVSFFHIMHVSTSSIHFWRSKGNVWDTQNLLLINIVRIINHFSAFVLAQLSGSDRNQETRFRGCNRSTSRLNYGFVFRSHNYGNYSSFITVSTFMKTNWFYLNQLVTNDRFRWLIHPYYWSQCLKDWIWWRNHVVAPFTEEFAFRYKNQTKWLWHSTNLLHFSYLTSSLSIYYRACMLPILLGHYSKTGAVIMSPFFFGIAHFHQ